MAFKFPDDVRKILYEEIPRILREHPEVRGVLRELLVTSFAPKEQTEDRFEQLLQEIRQMREDSDRRFEEFQKRCEAYDRRFEEFQKRFEVHDRRFHELLEEIRRVDRRIDRTIGALGARWGLSSEHAFREAIKAVIEGLTGLKVERYRAYDDTGEVFGWPDQVEIDLVIRDGAVWVMEIKSSVSKAEAYAFSRKVSFYERKEGKRVSRKMIVSPMIDPAARKVAEALKIECYTAPEDIPLEDA